MKTPKSKYRDSLIKQITRKTKQLKGIEKQLRDCPTEDLMRQYSLLSLSVQSLRDRLNRLSQRNLLAICDPVVMPARYSFVRLNYQ